MKKINIAVVGLGFGISFARIYCSHPDVGEVTIYDTCVEYSNKLAEELRNVKIANSFDDILNDPTIDAVHIVTPIPMHAEQSIAVLNAGKHCACAVPMATSLEDIRRIVAAKRKSGKNYMMMETTLYSYQFFYISEMIQDGRLGKIQFLRGSHYQNMEGWPGYWMGLPPMWYGTHAIGPMVALSGSRICRVNCFGSGTMAEDLVRQYGNPYPIESALFEFENGLKGEATRSLFETTRVYQEGLFVYGSNSSFEWAISDSWDPYVSTSYIPEGSTRARIKCEQVQMPHYYHILPEELWRFDKSGHHGSHPHLVHEFVRSCVEERKPRIDEILAGNITAAGICAHESAMRNGEAVIVPKF